LKLKNRESKEKMRKDKKREGERDLSIRDRISPAALFVKVKTRVLSA